MTQKEAYDLFHSLGLSKEELLTLLTMTLVEGGLTKEQIHEIAAEWHYFKQKDMIKQVNNTH